MTYPSQTREAGDGRQLGGVDNLFADCCFGSRRQHGGPECDPRVADIANKLTPNQVALLEDICRCPGLYAGQYVHDGAGIEHLPSELWWQSYAGPGGFLGLGKAYPSDLGVQVNAELGN